MSQSLNRKIKSTKSKKRITPLKVSTTNHSKDRDTFIGDIRESLNKIESKMASVRDDGSRLSGDLTKSADKNLMKLDSKYKELKAKIDRLKTSSQKNWDSDKAAIKKSFRDLSKNFRGLFT